MNVGKVGKVQVRGRLLASLAMLGLVLASGLYGLQYQSSVILPNNNSGVSWPSCIALNGEQRLAYAGGVFSDRLCCYNLASGATVASVECKSCHNLTYDPDRGLLYALAWEDGALPKLYVYGPSLNPVAPPINLSVVPGALPWEKEVKVAVASAWNRLYCLYYDYAGAKLASVDLTSYQVTQIATVGNGPRGYGYSGLALCGGRLYCVAGLTEDVTVVDVASNTVIDMIDLDCSAITATPACNNRVCVSTQGNQSVAVIDCGSNQILDWVTGFTDDVWVMVNVDDMQSVFAGNLLYPELTPVNVVEEFSPVSMQITHRNYQYNFPVGDLLYKNLDRLYVQPLPPLGGLHFTASMGRLGVIRPATHQRLDDIHLDEDESFELYATSVWPGYGNQDLVCTSWNDRLCQVNLSNGQCVDFEQLGCRASRIWWNPVSGRFLTRCIGDWWVADVDAVGGHATWGQRVVGPAGMAVNPVDGDYYVGSGPIIGSTGVINVFNAATNQHVTQMPVPAARSYLRELLWKPAGDKLYCPARDQLNIYNCANNTLITSIAELHECDESSRMAWNADDDKVYVCGESDSLYIVDGTANTLIARLELPDEQDAVFPVWDAHNDRLFIGVQRAYDDDAGEDYDGGPGGYVVVDGTTNEFIATHTEPSTRPMAIAVGTRRNEVYLLMKPDVYSREIWFINGVSNTCSYVLDLDGRRADNLIYVEDRLYVTCTTGEFLVIDCESHSIVQEVNGFESLGPLAYDPINNLFAVCGDYGYKSHVLVYHETGAGALYSTTSDATAPNNGRHLVRDPQTGDLHMVYVSADGVHYAASTDDGESWTVEDLGPGCWPTVDIDRNNRPWVAYVDMNHMVAKIKTATGWTERLLYASNDFYLGAPSLVVSNLVDEHVPDPFYDLGYAVFPESVPENPIGPDFSRVVVVAFDQNGVYHEEVTLDQAIEPNYLVMGNPCIARTPGDSLHIVWEYDITEDHDQSFIKYTTSRKLLPWLVKVQGLQPTDFASPVAITDAGYYYSPFVEAWGDSVHAAFTHSEIIPEQTSIQRKARCVQDLIYEWGAIWDVRYEGCLSEFPVVSTGFFTGWQEHTYNQQNHEARGKWTDDMLFNLSATPTPSRWPHCDVELSGPGGLTPPDCIRSIWTEEEVPGYLYRIGYSRRWHVPMDGGPELPGSYYSAGVGESLPSPYCLKRDSRVRFRGLGFDIGSKSLEYRLPYLDPLYGYELRLLVAHAGKGEWSQDILADGVLLRTVEFDSIGIDTLWLELPTRLYANDAAVKLSISRLRGQYAVLAGLALYQVNPPRQREGQQAEPARLAREARLLPCSPSPFSTSTSIAFQLASVGSVNLEVCDASGRVVKELLNGVLCTPGQRAVSWRGDDRSGRKLPAGVYFLRMQVDGAEHRSKVVLSR